VAVAVAVGCAPMQLRLVHRAQRLPLGEAPDRHRHQHCPRCQPDAGEAEEVEAAVAHREPVALVGRTRGAAAVAAAAALPASGRLAVGARTTRRCGCSARPRPTRS
jgi:hypothetical protein